MMPKHRFLALVPVILVVVRAALAGDDLLTLERIYESGEFSVPGVSARWLDDGSGYTTLEDSEGPFDGRDIVFHDVETGARNILVAAERLVPGGRGSPLSISDYAFSDDRSLLLVFTNTVRVWRYHTRGDYWILDRTSRELRKLGGDVKESSLMFATLSPSGEHVAYVRENDLWVEDLGTREIRALTTDGGEKTINGTFDWVYEEELGLRKGFRWSPDSRRLAYWRIESDGVREFPIVNTIDSLYPAVTWIPYPKVGERNSSCRVGVVSVGGGKTRWLDVPGDPRNHYIARMDWARVSDELILQQLNRLQNANRVMIANASTGKVRDVLTERDDAWVDIHDELFWIHDGDALTWLSERDGWRHAYIVTRSGERVELMTPGDFDVVRLLRADDKSERLYFIASPENATQRYLYSQSFDGSGLTRLSPEDQRGTHSYSISPDARYAIHRHSALGVPTTTDLVRLPSHERVRVLVDPKEVREKLGKLKRGKEEFLRLEIDDGIDVDAWCITPSDLDPEKKYPLVVYVYGEPAGQTTRDSWGGRGYLWHLKLAQKGWIVVSFDNRGTPAPRGRNWRKCVYRKVGILHPKDQAAALETFLAGRPYIDRDRVAVWGWSGGGSTTLQLLFKYPKVYKTGISIAPVPNQRFYDTIYQERYMGLPKDNVDGFREGSAITFAKNLEGNLLVVHGTADDNCHYQGTEALIDELIRHKKQFEMFAYPMRTHAIRERKNTSMHLRTMMLRFLEKHLD